MSEVLRTVMQNAPYVGAGVMYGIALPIEQAIVRRVAERRAPANEVYEDLVSEAQKPSRLHRFATRALGPLAVTCALAGGAIGNVFQEEGKVDVEPKIQMVVDRSGASGVADQEGVKPSNKIDEIVKEFAKHDGTSTELYIGQGGDIFERSYSQLLNEVRPFGDAPMQKAVRSAIDNIYGNTMPGQNTKNAVVVLTNGNTFGETNSVVKAAKESDVSIYVKDVSDSPKDPEAIRQIVEKTGGAYFDSSKDPEELYEQVKDKSEGQIAQEEAGSLHDLPEKSFIALLSILAVGVVGRLRPKMPLTFKGTDIGK